MSLGNRSSENNAVMKEIESWAPFGEALREEDLELYQEMMRRVCDYLPSMEVSADPFPNDALFMGLVFLQHRMIEQLAAKVEKLEKEKQRER